jgi:hypothetical protein
MLGYVEMNRKSFVLEAMTPAQKAAALKVESNFYIDYSEIGGGGDEDDAMGL